MRPTGRRVILGGMLDETRSRTLAAELGRLTETLLWSRHEARVRAAWPGARLATRVGRGQATHHQVRDEQQSVITFGWRMVQAKSRGPDAVSRWLSGREILRRGYFDGRVGLLEALSHAACHEFAHLVQTAEGGRRRGSVHNKAFYAILDGLHADGSADALRRALRQRFEALGLPVDETARPGAEALARALGQVPAPARSPRRGLFGRSRGAPARCTTRFAPGDAVVFEVQGRRITGVVRRINRRTVTVVPDVPDRAGQWWRVGPRLLSPLDVDDARTDARADG